jgi:hypothetical protein
MRPRLKVEGVYTIRYNEPPGNLGEYNQDRQNAQYKRAKVRVLDSPVVQRAREPVEFHNEVLPGLCLWLVFFDIQCMLGNEKASRLQGG